jgi:hypothetical protein
MTGDTLSTEDCSTLAAELEAFLAGRYSEWLRARGEAVPAWAHLNRLAHAAPETVLALARGPASQRREAREAGWDEALERIAQEVDEVADGRPAAVAAVQRVVLVPLELQLAVTSATALGPGQLAGVVWAALQRATGARPPRL